jgi:hypothetical protein
VPAKPWVVKPLVLPYGGEEFIVLPVDYADGLTLVAVGNGESKDITEESPDEELFALVMGETWQQMLDARCPYPVMFRAGMASVQYQLALVSGIDSDAAVAAGERVWESGTDPEMMAALVEAANLSSPKTSTPSTSTATARKTPPPASGRTTNSRKTTPRTAPKKKPAPRSTGTRSSSTGR